MYMHVTVKSMNFGGGGGSESLHCYDLKKNNFSLQEKRVGGGVTVKKITSSKTCHVHGV